ncbi:hypothetical protein LC613_35020 [Nostoc sphaeroides CHAB 2801]|uniref:hypothetical protein n=1 Tax=Nostoc sphaeroides TaxID=446679 RepID=UPI001E3D0C20|nr:hypothetical protein [Nostoc sphaeroides]MCC5632782.1 hypothetical protein [Nostoc sphaeroides CHAB 2801]
MSERTVSVVLTVMPPPDTFSYIQKMTLGEIPKSGAKHFNCERIILNIDEKSALELYNNYLRSKELDEISGKLNSLDLDEIRRYIRPELRERPPIEYLTRKIGDEIRLLRYFYGEN